MSNTSVGAVYQQIINDVIDASRTDFEDGGVEEGVLEELRKVGAIKPNTATLDSFIIRHLMSIGDTFFTYPTSLSHQSEHLVMERLRPGRRSRR